MIVYKTTDRIPLKFGEIKVWISPLSFEQKTNILAATKMKSGVEVSDPSKQTFLSLKYGVKEIEGLKNPDGSDYRLELDENGVLTDECLSDLIDLEYFPKLSEICIKLINGVKALDKIEGVEVDLTQVKSTKKKTS